MQTATKTKKKIKFHIRLNQDLYLEIKAISLFLKEMGDKSKTVQYLTEQAFLNGFNNVKEKLCLSLEERAEIDNKLLELKDNG